MLDDYGDRHTGLCDANGKEIFSSCVHAKAISTERMETQKEQIKNLLMSVNAPSEYRPSLLFPIDWWH